jgi:gliding motility-associated-like protein
MIFRPFLLLLLFITVCTSLFSQVPLIQSITPGSAEARTEVTITGSNFSSSPGANRVFFGASYAPVISASSTELVVKVPFGATYQPVWVANFQNKSSSFSNVTFNTIYKSANDILSTDFDLKYLLSTGVSPQAFIIQDVDYDGNPDLVVINSIDEKISVYRNLTAAGDNSFNFSRPAESKTGNNPQGICMADINADGLPDIIVTNKDNNTVSVFQSDSFNGNFNINAKIDFATGPKPGAVTAADFDGDGRIDIAVANTGDNTISIFRNTGSLDYNTSLNALEAKIDITTGNNPQWLSSVDLDGDGKPELVVANTNDNTISIFPNIATTGSISTGSFAAKLNLMANAAPNFVTTGDIDGDGKPEILATNHNSANISVFRNTSLGGVSFSTKIDVATPLIPRHMALGDIDGDGRADLSVTFLNSTKVSLFRNSSTAGAVSFASNTDLTADHPALFTGIVDLNKDGMPDIVTSNELGNNLNIFRHHSLKLTPVITSFTPMEAANGETVTITGRNFSGATGVNFGDVAAQSFIVNSPTTITAIAGTGTTGNITVITADGTGQLAGYISKAKPAFTYADMQVYKKGAAILPLVPLHTGGQPTGYAVTGQRLAGQQTPGLANGTGTNAKFNRPTGTVMDKNGNIYVADKLNNRIRKVSPTGAVTTFAGTGWGDTDGPADVASFKEPNGLAIDNVGNIYVADAMNNKIRKITPAGNVTTLAGSGATGGIDGPGAAASFSYPTGVAVDATGNVFVTDYDNNTIRKIAGGMVTTFSGQQYFSGNADGPVATAKYIKPYSIAIDKLGNMFVAEKSGGGIRQITPQGMVFTITHISDLQSISTDAAGNLYVTDNNRILKIASWGEVSIIKEGFSLPEGILVSQDGTIYFCELNTITKLVYTTSYSITPALPGGLSLNIATGVVSGIPTSTSPQTKYTITAGNNNGTSQTNVNITVKDDNQQPPVVTSLMPVTGRVGSTITISGKNFSNSNANNMVYFGATKGTVTRATASELSVIVPEGATYSKVSALNTETDLTGYSAAAFSVTFPSTHKIITDNFEPKVEFAAGKDTYTVAIADLDGDGKADMLVSDMEAKTVATYLNTSVKNDISARSFMPAAVLLDVGADPKQLSVGDLDGDGKPDIVVVNYYGQNYISVLRNTSVKGTISFAPKINILSGTYPCAATIGDIDTDGKPEILVYNSLSRTLSVFKNFSTKGTISTESFIKKADIPSEHQAYDIKLTDIDGDGKPDIVYSAGALGGISIVRNKATQGIIDINSFEQPINFSGAVSSQGVAVGDLDNDGKPDVVVCNQFARSVSVYKNTSLPGSITTGSFAQRVDFAVSFPMDVQISDIDGDGNPDLVFANSGLQTISILRNNASSGGITATSFLSPVSLPTTNVSSTAVGDLDGDGKPEIAAATSNSITVFRYNPHEAVTDPLAFGVLPNKSLCSPDFDPGATSSSPIIYTSNNPAVAIIIDGKIHITGIGTAIITANDGSYIIEQTLTVTNTDATPTVRLQHNPSIACEGFDVTFYAMPENAGNNATYQWYFNGVAAGTNSSMYAVASIKTTDIVTCTVTNTDGCLPATSAPAKSNIEITLNTTVSISIKTSQQEPVCPGTAITYTATPSYSPAEANFEPFEQIYQWRVNGVAAGTNSPEFTSITLKNGDEVTCTFSVGGKCLIIPSAISAPLSAAVNPANVCDITIPNTFTPNGDGVNDTWRLDNIRNLSLRYTVRIYNRYGSLIFQSTNNSLPWDGTYHGKPMPAGVYYYIINLTDTASILSGWVSVIR